MLGVYLFELNSGEVEENKKEYIVKLKNRASRTGAGATSQYCYIRAIESAQLTLCSPVMASYFLWHAHSHQVANTEDD
jgi:hypothetical protein